jgi:hypothetical protein
VNRRRLRTLVIITVITASLALAGAMWLLLGGFGEPERHFLSIQNRVGTTIVISRQLEDGTRLEVMRIAPGRSEPVALPGEGCRSGRVVAETTEGRPIATRPPSANCDSAPWIIDPGEPVAP